MIYYSYVNYNLFRVKFKKIIFPLMKNIPIELYDFQIQRFFLICCSLISQCILNLEINGKMYAIGLELLPKCFYINIFVV